MIITGKKFSKPAMSRVINGDTVLPKEIVAEPKYRLDILLTQKYPSYNRSTLQKFIELGYVTVDGELARQANQKLVADAKIELKVPEKQKNVDLVPKVIYEDENVLVLDKPAGLLSMAKGEYCPESTLEDYGLLVHRLDRDTSGVVILAKDPATQRYLRRQFQERKVHKTYYAIVCGKPKMDEAQIDLPLARDLKHPTTFRVDPNGKAAQTYYRVVKSDGRFSLIELKPRTGRTHQLRVHLKYLGCPILGDPVYGDGKNDPILSERRNNVQQEGTTVGMKERLYLHAAQLEITLPGGKRTIFEARLPKEFDRVL